MKLTRASLAIAAFAAAIAVPGVSQAAPDGTITFKGNISAQTCTVSGNGGGKDFTVTLPSVSVSTLSAAGQVSGRTPFTIALTNCSTKTGVVHTFFESGPTTNQEIGTLELQGADAAKNVQVQLLNADHSPIKAGAEDASQGDKKVSIVDGNATLQYYAQYYATGAAGAGPANTQVMYTMAYE
ncbi:fimbrial protein [Burkholderia ambifaria]|uniref:Fimbrial protein n=1 Tax=Burkholderia ambifaria MEX-5 TaxID=396597 RepID=B1T309_9BURK|nr:fimbrial protein [Burkholderia ambifaria]EDT42061.1 Fimbrial protein [Burkholderia ambifaria MEX-5]